MDMTQFNLHLDCIRAKAAQMRAKATVDPNYQKAAIAATTLVSQLVKAVDFLLQVDSPIDEKKELAFKKHCMQSLNEAKLELEQHRGWKRVLVVFLMALTFPISLPLYAAGFFSTKTDSAIKLLEFEKSLQPTLGS